MGRRRVSLARAARALILAAALLAPLTALAQENFVPRDVTRGVAVPDARVAGDHDATAVTLNPAGLATLRGPHLAFASTLLDRDQTLAGGGGSALFLALPLRLPLPGDEVVNLSYGFAFQTVAAPDAWTGAVGSLARQSGSYLLNSVGIGNERAAIGWTIGNFFWADTPQRDSITTHHVGLTLRPTRHFAAGLTLRDVFEPVGRSPEEKFDRTYDAELAFRPFGDARLEVAGGAALGEDGHHDFRGRVAWRAIPGVTFFGRLDSIERNFFDPDGPASRDTRVMAGLSIDGLDALVGRRRHGVGASYGILTSSASPRAYAGSSVMVRWSAERYQAIVEPERVVKVELNAAEDDRAFVASLLELRALEKRRGISGVLLVLPSGGQGFARAEELRRAVGRLRESGRWVASYLHTADMYTYYAAAACDLVLLHPSAEVNLTGTAVEGLYFAELLLDLGVKTQVVRVAEEKSAPEALTRRGPSKAARRQIRTYLHDVIGEFTRSVGSDRTLEPARVRAILERPGMTPEETLRLGLVDEVLHPDELERAVERAFGRPITVADVSRQPDRAQQWAAPRIAVIHVEGDILPGRQTGGLLTPGARGEEISRAIRRARKSRDVKAIILRVESPGGAVLPSEQIAREVELTVGEKPILVSMGNVAGSGGYMVSAHADRIFGSASTLTGSIGVFTIKLSVRDLFERLGIAPASFKVGEHADARGPFRPWTEAEREARVREVDHVYRRFLSLVAAGRGLSEEEVREVAGGRIYAGVRAVDVGLVDEVGGFLDTLREARRRAGIADTTDVRVIQLPERRRSILDQLFSGGAGEEVRALRAALPPALRELIARLPASLLAGGGMMARLGWIVADPVPAP